MSIIALQDATRMKKIDMQCQYMSKITAVGTGHPPLIKMKKPYENEYTLTV